MSSSRRTDRVAEAIREEVALYLRQEAKDPRIGFVTITAVEITRDLRTAKVFVSALGSDEEKNATFEGLESIAPRMRGHIGRTLRLRSAPELIFKFDRSVGNAARIETLLEAIARGENPAAEDDDDARAAAEAEDDEDEGDDDAPGAGRPDGRRDG
jgi:ribosome-binding factor A